jgi:hypothetical protein
MPSCLAARLGPALYGQEMENKKCPSVHGPLKSIIPMVIPDCRLRIRMLFLAPQAAHLRVARAKNGARMISSRDNLVFFHDALAPRGCAGRVRGLDTALSRSADPSARARVGGPSGTPEHSVAIKPQQPSCGCVLGRDCSLVAGGNAAARRHARAVCMCWACVCVWACVLQLLLRGNYDAPGSMT